MEGPLTELRNQRLPRRKTVQTYGKKKVNKMPTSDRELFGWDEGMGWEEALEGNFAQLKLQTPKSRSGDTKSATTTSTTKREVVAVGRKTQRRGPPLAGPDNFAEIEPLLQLSGHDLDIFQEVSDKLARTFEITKIGEGSFAEVFKLSPRIDDSTACSSTPSSIPQDGAIIKIIPLHHPGAELESHDRLSSVNAVTREIRILRTLDSIHGFTRFRGVRLVTGPWPKPFMAAFRAFKRLNRSRAINGSPEDDFGHHQIYAVVEMGDAGTEISRIRKPNVFQIYDILWTTAVLLANAEEQVEFEHRDLHISNVCIKALPPPASSDEEDNEGSGSGMIPTPDVDHTLLTNMSASTIPSTKLGLANLKVTLIDYTITRCILVPQNPKPTRTSTNQPEIAYDKMSFVSGLTPSTEPKWEDELQHLTYLKCKAAVEHTISLSAPSDSSNTNNKWRTFTPRTNVIWLSYLLQVLSRRSHGRTAKYYIVKGSSKAATKLQKDMWDVLEEVQDALAGVEPDQSDDNAVGRARERSRASANTPGNGVDGVVISRAELERTPASAREFLGTAVEKGWVSREEVEALRARLEEEES